MKHDAAGLQARLGALFTTQTLGEPRAYFELFNQDGTLRARGVYRVYAFKGGTAEDQEKLMTEVFTKIRAQAGEEAHLYWRRPLEWSEGKISARFCVLNKEGADVTKLPDWSEDEMGRHSRDFATGKPIVYGEDD